MKIELGKIATLYDRRNKISSNLYVPVVPYNYVVEVEKLLAF